MIRLIYFFFFNDTATTEIYTLSLHDALPISHPRNRLVRPAAGPVCDGTVGVRLGANGSGCGRGSAAVFPARRNRAGRSEEHTSELQSQSNLVCRLLLEKKNIEACLHWVL